jgi:hypothetical protein
VIEAARRVAGRATSQSEPEAAPVADQKKKTKAAASVTFDPNDLSGFHTEKKAIIQ